MRVVEEYTSIDEFYDTCGGRYSGESDYGNFNWDDGNLPECRDCLKKPWSCHFHKLSVSFVQDIGVWYAHADARRGRVTVIGQLTLNGESEKEVYAHFRDWAKGGTPGRPLSWFRQRIAEWNAAR